jgi:hypothetical protein
MELSDLQYDERLALVALVELIGEANTGVTEEESARIQEIVAAFGQDAYRELAAEADERFTDEDALRDYLREIGRPEARELIYGTALGVAIGDTIQPGESALLDWLAEEWKIDVKYDLPREDS